MEETIVVVNIEGVEFPWEKETITVAEIRQLGKFPAGQEVVIVDMDNNEVTLKEDEIIELKKGHRFGKKIKFKRG